jgi:integrase
VEVIDVDDRFFTAPILNNPYEYPKSHWELDPDGQPTQKILETRRGAEFITPIPKPKKRKRSGSQQSMVFDEGSDLSTKQQQYDATSNINLLRREYRPLLRAAGLPEGMTFHDLRSVFASAALATQPVTFVSESLGHSTPVTTLRKYATAIPGAQRQVADAIESAFGA